MSEQPLRVEERPAARLDEDRIGAVRAELELIVKHPLFGHSKRYPALLRYVVDRTLSGHQEELKERTVGIEALGRPASYDTAQDPVVRTTAAEVRKRLAQSYLQAGEASVRIGLPVGSYIPQFDFVTSPAGKVAPLLPVASSSARRVWFAHRNIALAVVLLAGLSAASYWLWWPRSTPIERFWEPILEADGTIKVSVGAAIQSGDTPTAGLVTLDATTAVSRVVGLLQQERGSFEVKGAELVGFADLRHHSMVAIGGFNNAWTLRVTDTLRFRFIRETSGRLAIADTKDAEGRRWHRELEDPDLVSGRVIQDYALVTRVRDSASGQWVVALGGIGKHGTAAAGEFLTSAEHMQRFADTAQPAWPKMNLQLVLSTEVHDGVAGPPRIVASYFWR